jgi:hypothetical protein
LELWADTNSSPVVYTFAYFNVKLGQGIPSNLRSLGSVGQVLTVNGSGNGLQYSTIANTSVTGSPMTITVSYQVAWTTTNGSGQRYAWIQRNYTFNRVAMVTSVPFGGGDGCVQSSSATF